MEKIWNIEWSREWFQFILDHPEKDWSFAALSANLNVTVEVVVENLRLPWQWGYLSKNPSITWEDIRDHPECPWHVTPEVKRAEENAPPLWRGAFPPRPNAWALFQETGRTWSWDTLSRSPSVTWEIICDNPQHPWEWESVSANPNISWTQVQENPDKGWNWFWLSGNPMTRAKKEFLAKKRKDYYAPIIERILIQKGVPCELTEHIVDSI